MNVINLNSGIFTLILKNIKLINFYNKINLD